MNKLQKFITTSNDVMKDSYRWNLISSVLFAFQSVITLMVLTRRVGIEQSGIFTIAYANASLFLFIGKYGVRYYQVSDVKQEHTFKDFQMSRACTVLTMILSTVIYVTFGFCVQDYSAEKSLIIFLVCILKIPDAIEDVYYGEYQRRGRLDIGAKASGIRLGVTVFSLLALVIVTRELLISLAIVVLLSYGVMWFFLRITCRCFEMEGNASRASVLKILFACFPLFIGNFLSQYIGNAPKYAIDSQLGDELQACYGFISMPVFVIGLLNNVIFAPIIRTMAEKWTQNCKKSFLLRLVKQIIIVAGLTLVCVIGADLLGIPVLSLMYNTDLSMYKEELLILLVGGGFLALSGLLNTVLTIMRYQYPLFGGYVAVALIALICSDKVVAKWGMLGAAGLYTLLMLLLAVEFIFIFIFALVSDSKQKK